MPGTLDALLVATLQLAVGMFFAALLCDWRGEVTRGFLFLTSTTALAVGLLTLALAGLARVEGAERLVQAGMLSGLLAYTVLLAGERRSTRLLVGSVTLGLGLAWLILAALSRPSAALGPALTSLVFCVSAMALGTATAGLLLGHWYLVTPKLTSRPLRMMCDLLLVSLAPLTLLAGWYVLLQTDPPGPARGTAGLSGPLLWVGGGMITLFPFLITIAARACCIDGPGRGHSLQAATGLMYVVAAAVLAGGLAGNAVLLGG